MIRFDFDCITLEKALRLDSAAREVTLGLPSGVPFGDGRFPLTPEGAARLTDMGVRVSIERNAGLPIHYDDQAYMRAGASIVSRPEVLRADIIVSPAPLTPREAASLRRGSLLITLSRALMASQALPAALLRAGVNVMAADLISDGSHRLVADILHEIDGCASIALASAMMTDPIYGKGILLGGVTGIVPCEVTIIGSGMGAIAAAHNAIGLGATVRMFDNDLYSLRKASRVLDFKPIASSIHPKVLLSALRSADVIIVTPTKTPFGLAPTDVDILKQRVPVFDLTDRPGYAFPGLAPVDLSTAAASSLTASDRRICYYNVGCRVPRTAAMALTNALTGNFETLREAHSSPASMPPSLRGAMMLYWGKCVNPALARFIEAPCFDINILNSGN